MIEVKHLYKSFEDKDVLLDINAVLKMVRQILLSVSLAQERRC